MVRIKGKSKVTVYQGKIISQSIEVANYKEIRTFEDGKTQTHCKVNYLDYELDYSFENGKIKTLTVTYEPNNVCCKYVYDASKHTMVALDETSKQYAHNLENAFNFGIYKNTLYFEEGNVIVGGLLDDYLKKNNKFNDYSYVSGKICEIFNKNFIGVDDSAAPQSLYQEITVNSKNSQYVIANNYLVDHSLVEQNELEN